MTVPFFTLAQLKQIQTLDQAVAEFKTMLTGSGIAGITDWKVGTWQQTFLQLVANFSIQGQQQGATIAAMVMEPTSAGDWLTALSDSFFDNQRFLGSFAVCDLRLALAPGFGPLTFAPGELVISVGGAFNFQNKNLFTIAGNTTGSQQFQATDLGSGPNTAFLTPQTGSLVTAGNNAVTGLTAFSDPPATVSWGLVLGQDVETDASLHTRNETKWSSLSPGETTGDRVKYVLATVSSGTLFDAFIDPTYPRGPGTNDIYIAGALAPATAGQVSLYSGSLQALFTAGNLPIAGGMSPAPRIFVTGAIGVSLTQPTTNSQFVLYVAASSNTALVFSEFQTAVNAWISTVPIGGVTYNAAAGTANIADIDKLIDLIYEADTQQIRKVKIFNMTDVTLGPTQKLVAPTWRLSTSTDDLVPPGTSSVAVDGIFNIVILPSVT